LRVAKLRFVRDKRGKRQKIIVVADGSFFLTNIAGRKKQRAENFQPFVLSKGVYY
jgi:hypothetical protein